MQYKLYLNGQYLKTVDFKGFPPDITWMFYIGKLNQRCIIRCDNWAEELVKIIFRGGALQGMGRYYGTVDKKTEKKIRRLK